MSMVDEQTDAGATGDSGSLVIGRSSGAFGARARLDPASPASVAARIKRRTDASTSVAAAGTGTGTGSGSAPMGGRTPAKDLWGDGMINEADRGSAHDHERATPQMTIG